MWRVIIKFGTITDHIVCRQERKTIKMRITQADIFHTYFLDPQLYVPLFLSCEPTLYISGAVSPRLTWMDH